MFGSLFRRPSALPIPDAARLGASMLAVTAPLGAYVPEGCVALVIERDGRRRLAGGERLAGQAQALAWCLHPGPYECVLQLQASGDIGLLLRFALDTLDLRSTQQRIDLFLASEADGPVSVLDFAAQMAWALQQECQRGCLRLGPSGTLAEWQQFRSGVDQLLYARFGVLVQECVQVELNAASAMPTAVARAPLASSPRALQRLRLELPCLICAVRQAVLPAAQEQFRQHQGLLLRLDQVCMASAKTGVLSADPAEVMQALDAAWALLAHLKVVGEAPLDCLFAEAERIVAVLEAATRELTTV